MSVCLAISITVTMAVSGRGVIAQPLPQLDVSQASEFHHAITALAEQAHVTLIAEGVPRHPHLSLPDVAKLTERADLDDEVETVADAYDYSVERRGDVFVLKKRYSDPHDLPALTPAECEHTLALLQRVAEPFNPHALVWHIEPLTPHSPQLEFSQVQIVHPFVKAFADSLTPDQLEGMNKDKLLVSSLSQDQKALARRLRLSAYTQQPMEDLARFLPQLKQVEQNAVFRLQETSSSPRTFGYLSPEGPEDPTHLLFHPLTRMDRSQDLGISFPSDLRPTDADPTDPNQASMEVSSTTTQTLSSVIAFLNAQSGGALHANVDTAVGAKPVSVAGSKNAPADQVLQALADVYGLSLLRSPLNNPIMFTITLPDVTPPSELVALPSSLRQALPEPFARAAHLEKMVAEEQKFYDFWHPSRDPKRLTPPSHTLGIEETQAEMKQAMLERKRAVGGLTEIKAGLGRVKQAQSALPTLRLAAIQRLRVLVEPRLRMKPDGIAISDLGESEHEAIATIFMAEAAQALGDLITQAVPDTALHFDQARIGGGIQENSQPPSFSIMFHPPIAAGGLEINSGSINVPYNKSNSNTRTK